MLKWVHTQLRLAKGAKGSSSADISLLLLISCSPLLVSNDLGLGPEVELKQTFFFSPCCLPRKYLVTAPSEMQCVIMYILILPFTESVKKMKRFVA
ncbi:hypothetical protein PPACK8108_LOCUS5527 [Phakopsora pachyrhizi]|uniref:Secreted protein n=1 Tax=Phakopsora pachyrhizi TaxID=170000 RepID=A0AAV0AP85_PHAPC|nr:hypothetical protein PPACK8108_LOCUS5527 [Phakopsora pachyrhizi]